jgi:[acyl-carrier-protein] S-malonyltransferase
MKLAFLLSGQGSQKVGMGVALAEYCAECRAMFEAADRALGFPLSKIMAEGPAEELRRTAITQPALVTLTVIQARYLMSLGLIPDVLAGHSLGQTAAFVVADALDFESTVRLVAARGQLIQQTVPEGEGGMMAIVGLDREIVYAACDEARALGVVNVACHNAPGQTVISGDKMAVAAAAERCEAAGGGVVPIAVSAPFHCDLLTPMVPLYARLLETTTFKDPVIAVIDNVTAEPITRAAAARQSLITQLTAPVLFEESLRYLADAGVRHFIQCGPGKNLLTFARRVVPKAEFMTFEEAARQAALV